MNTYTIKGMIRLHKMDEVRKAQYECHPLHAAIMESDIDMLTTFIECDDVDLNHRVNGMTALEAALQFHEFRLAETILDYECLEISDDTLRIAQEVRDEIKKHIVDEVDIEMNQREVASQIEMIVRLRQIVKLIGILAKRRC